MSPSLDAVTAALDATGCRWVAKGAGHVQAQCPAHEDRAPSLSIDHRGDRTLVICHAGCQVDEVVSALGLTFADLFDEQREQPERGMVVRSYVYTDYKGDPWIIKDRLWPKSFIQRLPGTEPGDRSGLKGRVGILYHYPQLLAGISEGRTPWLVEGEKDVETAERHGILATCVPAINGRWEAGYTATLAKADEVVIVVDQDKVNPKTGKRPGHEFALMARAELRAAGVRVRCLRAREGKDLTDHFEAGYGVNEFVVDTGMSIRPRGMTGDVLLAAEFPELHWAIPDLLPAGLAILAASPKAGKSWMGLDFALSVAAGGMALGAVRANRGSTLYLAREDGYRRVQSRMDLLLKGDLTADVSKFEVVPLEEQWVGGAEGVAAMTDWAEEVGDPLLVVLDTLAKVEPDAGDGDRYRNEYAMMARYKQFADQFNCTVLVIHHDRKSTESDGDVFTKVSGTRGLTGAADTMLYLDRKRGESDGKLHITGRDVADQELGLHKMGPLWVLASPDDLPEPAHHRPLRVV